MIFISFITIKKLLSKKKGEGGNNTTLPSILLYKKTLSFRNLSSYKTNSVINKIRLYKISRLELEC